MFMAERGTPRSGSPVCLRLSDSFATVSRTVPSEEVVRSGDPQQFIHLAVDERHAEVATAVAGLPTDLELAAGIGVSTGRVVDFRAREHLSAAPIEGSAPLVYPTHLQQGHVDWPREGRKPNGLMVNEHTKPLLLPAGTYVLVKRLQLQGGAAQGRRRRRAAGRPARRRVGVREPPGTVFTTTTMG